MNLNGFMIAIGAGFTVVLVIASIEVGRVRRRDKRDRKKPLDPRTLIKSLYDDNQPPSTRMPERNERK